MASYATKLRQLYPYKAPTTSIDHLVIGGGVVGLSVAAGLVNTCGKEKTTFLVERRGQVCHHVEFVLMVAWSGDYVSSILRMVRGRTDD
jgi:heterodisulfide reductase subunit A-like polyferredoxin